MPSLPNSKAHSPLTNGSLPSLPDDGRENASASSPSDSQLSELKDPPQSEIDESGNGEYPYLMNQIRKVS